MYKILIKDSKTGMYRFLTVRQEIIKEEVSQVTNPDSYEVTQVTTLVGTGEYETVEFSTKEKDELEKKCVELLSSYKITEFVPIQTLSYTTDLVWEGESKEN